MPRLIRRWAWARSVPCCRATATAPSSRATIPSSSSSAARPSWAAPAIATSSIATSSERHLWPIGDEALGLVGLDLAPLQQHALAEQRVGVPALDRRAVGIDRQQHLFDPGPVALQGHGIAARGADLAEADHA